MDELERANFRVVAPANLTGGPGTNIDFTALKRLDPGEYGAV